MDDTLWIMDEVGEGLESYCRGPDLTLPCSSWEGRSAQRATGRQVQAAGSMGQGRGEPSGTYISRECFCCCSPRSLGLPHTTPALPPGPAGTESCSSGSEPTWFGSKTNSFFLGEKKGGRRGRHGLERQLMQTWTDYTSQAPERGDLVGRWC